MNHVLTLFAWCGGSVATLEFLRRLRQLVRAILAVVEGLRQVSALSPRVNQLTVSVDALTKRFEAIEQQIAPPTEGT